MADLIEPAVSAVGFLLWGLEYLPQGKHALLRVYIDHENGIGVDDCEMASRQISAVLDVADPIKSHYTLEVSSPGMDRPLFNLEQFRYYCGEVISCRLHPSVTGRKKFKGVLQAVKSDTITLQVDGETIDIPFADVDQAQLVPQF